MNKRLTYMLLLFFTWWTVPVSHAQEQAQYYEQGLQAYEEGEYEEAYIHLKNALQIDPNLLAARLLLAEVYFYAGYIAGAEKESEEALMLGADINLALPVYGGSLVLQNKVDKLFELEKVSGSFTVANQFEWALLKGQAYLLQGEEGLARNEFEKAATLFPADARSINSLAAMSLNSGKSAQAQEQVVQSISLDPQNAKTWELRGELAFKERDYEQALEYLNKAHEIDDHDFRVLRSLARVHLHLGNQAELQHYLDLILELSPDDPAATLLSAVMLIGRDDTELGESMLASLSLRLSSLDGSGLESSDRALLIQASADYVRGSDQNAISLFRAYLGKNKSDLAAIRMLVDLYVRNGKPEKAMELLISSKSEIAGDLGLSLQLLHFYIQKKQSYAVKALLEELKALDAQNPYVLVLEAEFLRSSGQPREALALLEEQDLSEESLLDYDLLHGALRLELKMYDEARQSAVLLEKRYPGSVRASNFSAVTYLRSGRLDDAQKHINHALQLAPRNMEARFNQAMLLKKRNQLDESKVLLNRILADHPRHTKSILLMARIFFIQGAYKEAIVWSNKIYLYDETSNRPAELQLEIYTLLEDWDKALLVAVQLTRANPLNADYLVSLANIYITQRDYGLAQRPLQRLMLLWEKDPEKLQYHAALYVRAKDLEGARKSLEAALALDAESFEIRLGLARLHLLEGQSDAAAAILTSLSEEFDERAELSFLEGEIALSRGQLEIAQAHYLRAFELDPDDPAAINRLFQLSVKDVGGEAFTQAMEARLKKSSLPVWAVRLLADSYLSQGKTEQAARYYENLLAVKELENDPAILNNLANIYAADDLDKALATALRGLDEYGENSSALLDTIGWTLTRLGKNEEALPYLRKAYSRNSTDPEIRYHTGVTLLALDRTAEAERELNAALLGDDYPGRAEARRLVDSISR